MIREQFEETLIEKPPEGWSLGHVTLQLHNPEERVAVEAWLRDAFAVHGRIDRDGDREAVLTHAPTGLRVDSFPMMDQAAECADMIEDFADWHSFKKSFKPGSDLAPKVRSVAQSIRERALPEGDGA